jgi:ParB-like chromosome segregation protein Spo0J
MKSISVKAGRGGSQWIRTGGNMTIQMVDVKEMKPAKYNPRKDLKPADKQYQHIKNSIETFGYIEPIVWNKRTGNIVGGHQRFKILKAQGDKEVECVVVDFDDAKEKAANAALNKTSGRLCNDKESQQRARAI